MDPNNYKAWARGLKKAGYATHPRYPELLIGIIKDNRLYQYDKGFTGPVQPVVTRNEVRNQEAGKSENVVKDQNTVNFIIPSGKRGKGIINRIEFVKTIPGDNFSFLADELGMMRWELPKYNDLPRDAQLKPGTILFLQPKRNQAEQGKNYYIVKTGETMWMISQEFGIRLSRLYELNNLKEGQDAEPGTKLRLRNHK